MIKKHLACFDFDGTITFSDSLFPFILFSFGAFRTGVGLFLEIPTLIRFLFGSLGRQEVKERLLTQFFANTDLNTMNKLGHDFALEQLPKMTKKEALDAIG